MFMFKGLGLKLVPFLPQIILAFLYLLLNEPQNRNFLFPKLSQVVSIIKSNIRDYVDDIFKIIGICWNLQLSTYILGLLEELARVLSDGFRKWLPQTMPYILQVFHQDISEKRIPTICTLKTLIVFDTILDDYLNVIVPQIVNLFDLNEIPLDVRIAAYQQSEV
jgi:FKBP12-rapamycin complex-associated protein